MNYKELKESDKSGIHEILFQMELKQYEYKEIASKEMIDDTDFKLKLESMIPHGYYTYQHDRTNPDLYITSWFKEALKTKPKNIDLKTCQRCNKCTIIKPVCVFI